MVYLNDDPVLKTVRDRYIRGEFEHDIYDEDINECPVCGAIYAEKFYLDDDYECVGCNICIHEVGELF